MTLIKSSIYKVKGTLARYTGNNYSAPDVPQTFVFLAHGTEIEASIEQVEKASREEVNTYFGR